MYTGTVQAGLFTFFFFGAATAPGTVFLPGEEVFARPGPAVPSQPPQMRYPSRQWTLPQRLDLWPLLLPAEARARGEPCGELATSLLTIKPVGVYSTTLVQYLYISCYLSDNKPVLSYLLLCLLTAPEVGPLTSSPPNRGQSSGGSPVESWLHPYWPSN